MTAERQRFQPRKQPRQVRAELTRQRILTAAAHIFAEHGYAAGTTNRIAEQARISIGSLYQYYPNKDAILAELLSRHLDGDRATAALRADPRTPLEDIVRAFVRAVIENHLDDPRLLRIMLEQAPRTAELLEQVTRHQREVIGAMRELLDRHPGIRVRDREIAARLVVSTVEQTVHPLTAGAIDTTRLENELVAMLTGYLGLPR
ncbi:TetR/AcrR family transcriptional regulator [Pseudonocardiaceae bacterium YIM PH 21723]|nr:TetR/AcrR family transcriptional regulator [Pseudonocardiaceae bacterium YIM PH 21723]